MTLSDAIRLRDRVVNGFSLTRDESLTALGDLIIFLNPNPTGIVCDESEGSLRVDGRLLVIGMPYRMIRVIDFLCRAAPRYKQRTEIIDYAYRRDYAIDDRTIDSHIKKFRQLLPKDSPIKIVTRYGWGYGIVRTAQVEGNIIRNRLVPTTVKEIA